MERLAIDRVVSQNGWPALFGQPQSVDLVSHNHAGLIITSPTPRTVSSVLQPQAANRRSTRNPAPVPLLSHASQVSSKDVRYTTFCEVVPPHSTLGSAPYRPLPSVRTLGGTMAEPQPSNHFSPILLILSRPQTLPRSESHVNVVAHPVEESPNGANPSIQKCQIITTAFHQ